MTAEVLPHLGAALNALGTALLLAGVAAILRGKRRLHPRLMLGAVACGAFFLVVYVANYSLQGHRRFPGDDWVRTAFLALLGTHIVLAVVIVPLVLRTMLLAFRGRLAEHRRIVRVTLPVWLYVTLTGLVIYWMSHHLRPGA